MMSESQRNYFYLIYLLITSECHIECTVTETKRVHEKSKCVCCLYGGRVNEPRTMEGKKKIHALYTFGFCAHSTSHVEVNSGYAFLTMKVSK